MPLSRRMSTARAHGVQRRVPPAWLCPAPSLRRADGDEVALHVGQAAKHGDKTQTDDSPDYGVDSGAAAGLTAWPARSSTCLPSSNASWTRSGSFDHWPSHGPDTSTSTGRLMITSRGMQNRRSRSRDAGRTYPAPRLYGSAQVAFWSANKLSGGSASSGVNRGSKRNGVPQ
jgi:hypothetical protein